MENKATAALCILATTGRLGFLSTVMKDGMMTGIDVATTSRLDNSTLLHLKVIENIFAYENSSWSIWNPLIAFKDAGPSSLILLDGDKILKEVGVTVSLDLHQPTISDGCKFIAGWRWTLLGKRLGT